MYIVTIQNGNITREIHNESQKLLKGSVVKGINSIDTFSFSLSKSNIGWNLINDFTTLVTVYNTNRKRYEFMGRVLYSSNSMSESGLLTKDVTCESYFGFMCDSQQTYVKEQNWTVYDLLDHIITTHNSQLEKYKHFEIGEITVTDPNDNLYCGIQRDNTWNTIKTKLVDVLGGEIQFRISDGVTYIDYLTEIGTTKATKIELSRNMKAITQEKDPSAYVTRLIPLGYKLSEETEERLDISLVNDGLNYIDDTAAIEKYGLHIAYQEWDDVTTADRLKAKGEKWLQENNKLLVKYSITALDLSLIGLDIDDFEVCNRYPIENSLLEINDVARIIKKTIDICEEVKTSIEIGENFKTLSEVQTEQKKEFDKAIKKIEKAEGNFATTTFVISEIEYATSLINQTAEEIRSEVSDTYLKTSTHEEYKETVSSEIKQSAEDVTLKFEKEVQNLTEIDGIQQTEIDNLVKYIKADENGITIGSGDSAITLTLDNGGISFKKNGIQFGFWDGNDFYTGNIIVQVDERAQFGNFAFVPRTDGSLSFLKVGG